MTCWANPISAAVSLPIADSSVSMAAEINDGKGALKMGEEVFPLLG